MIHLGGTPSDARATKAKVPLPFGIEAARAKQRKHNKQMLDVVHMFKKSSAGLRPGAAIADTSASASCTADSDSQSMSSCDSKASSSNSCASVLDLDDMAIAESDDDASLHPASVNAHAPSSWDCPGVQLGGLVGRRCACFFCKFPLEKGQVRFQYVRLVNKMPVSVCSFCVACVPQEFRASSKRQLESQQASFSAGHIANADVMREIEAALLLLDQ